MGSVALRRSSVELVVQGLQRFLSKNEKGVMLRLWSVSASVPLARAQSTEHRAQSTEHTLFVFFFAGFYKLKMAGAQGSSLTQFTHVRLRPFRSPLEERGRQSFRLQELANLVRVLQLGNGNFVVTLDIPLHP